MDINAVIWDLGGVLLRTEDQNPRKMLSKLLKTPDGLIEFLVFESDSSRKSQLGEIGIEDHWEYVRNELKLSPQEMPNFRRNFWAGDVLDAQLVQDIRNIRESGYKTGLLSNAFPETRKFLADRYSLQNVFEQMVFSSEEGIMKPDRRIYQMTVDRLQVEPGQAVFIDDSPSNIAGARNAGLMAIQFLNPAQVRRDLKRLLVEETNE